MVCISLLLLVGCRSTTQVASQGDIANNKPRTFRTFSEYSELMQERFQITCKIPSGFKDQMYKEIFGIGPKITSSLGQPGYVYTPIVRSRDKQCLLMYPFAPPHIGDMDIQIQKVIKEMNPGNGRKQPVTNESIIRVNIVEEITAAFGISRDSIDLDNHLTIVAGKEARTMFNADSVFIYDIPLVETYKDKYVHCTGMVISKRNRPTMLMKWFFTEKGKKREKKYFDSFHKTIWYEGIN